VGVERQVIGGERHVVFEQELQAPLELAVDRGRWRPRTPVMHQDEVGVVLGGPLEQLD